MWTGSFFLFIAGRNVTVYAGILMQCLKVERVLHERSLETLEMSGTWRGFKVD